ncbi:transient-receptor-potential-like protein, partial [Lasius niger]
MDMTPLVLAAQRNNYEILKLLLDRGATLPMPHDVRCGCEDCLQAATGDPLRLSSTRISEYKALASPSLIALSSTDPLMTAFQLSWELRELAVSEPESRAEYMKLRRQVEKQVSHCRECCAVILMLVSQRAEVEIVRLLGTQEMKRNLEAYLARQRGAAPTPLEGIVVLYVFGFIWEETREISLGRMVIDIVKFFFIYTLVLFAFACGLNQLLWYFAELERQKCYSGMLDPSWDAGSDACLRWRRFSNLFESCQSLFWASFGMVGIETFELTGIKSYTRFWGLLMFGSYSVINVIVLLNLLIAMMSNSYAVIEEHSDTEWKFARTKLWMSYFEDSGTLPPPFNIFPPPKLLFRFFGLQKKSVGRRCSQRRRAREHKYGAVMKALIWRYIVNAHSEHEMEPVTEDDIHELKTDLSSWRCELLDILHKNGMDIGGINKKEKTVLGKKMKIWERRLMKDFQVAGPVNPADNDLQEEMALQQREDENIAERWKRVAKLAVLTSAERRWRQ